MKAAIFTPKNPNQAFLSITEMEKPESNNENIIVKVTGVGVCGSDLIKLNQSLVKPGTVLGHEMVGTIDSIPDALSIKYNLKVGDRIASSHHTPCGTCNYCLNKQESLCQTFKSTNFYPGAFCEYLSITEEHLKKTVIKIPTHIDNQTASFTEPLACCLKAIKRSRLIERKGNFNVAIYGLGSIGQLLGQGIKALRDNHKREVQTYSKDIKIIGVDLLESKHKLALANGFDYATNDLQNLLKSNQSTTIHTENKQAIKINTGDKNDVITKPDIIFLAAGADKTVELAIQNINIGGTIVVLSSVPNIDIAFANNEVYYKELSIIGSYSPNLDDLKLSMDMLSKHEVLTSKLLSHYAQGLENLGSTIMQCNKEQGMKVYLDFE